MLRFPARTRRCGAFVGLALFLLIGLVTSVFACNDTTSTTTAPTTGILIRAEQLTSGRGCGIGSTQIYKYAVVVFQYDGSGDPNDTRKNYNHPYTSNVFDCYVDGEFINLTAVGTNSTYRMEVYAYNADTFNAHAQVINAAGTKVQDLRSTTPTYTTECTATESSEVEQLAECDPLSAGLAGVGAGPDGGFQTKITLATQSFHLPDGRPAVCALGGDVDAGTDGGDADADAADADAEAGIVDAGDAGDADADADTDAGDAGLPTVTFAKVRVRARIGGNVIAQPVDIECPTTYVANVDSFPQAYTVDVGLIDSAGNPLGETTCAVTTQTGIANPVVCP